MNFRPQRRPDPVLDITPMIDIVFQLVLFFMVSTTFVNAPGIQVDLPRSSAQMLSAEDDDLNVWMSCADAGCASVEVFLDDEPMTLPSLTARFTASGRADPDTLVVIKADRGVPHGHVVQVMDAARAQGLTRLAIATEASEQGAEDDE